MIVAIKNDELEVGFSTKGAELQYLKDTKCHINYLWNGDDGFWAKFSPVLFPIVGALKNNQYQYKGITYTLPRHGFARDMEFSCQQISAVEISFTLKHNEETLKVYPFEFELTLIYKLRGTSLSCSYKVSNPADKDLLFSIGGHPAFAVPLNNEGTYTDYYLQFNNDDELIFYHIVDNLVTETTTTLPLKEKRLPLQHQLFYNDALVFKTLKSNHIQLLNHKHNKGIDFSFEGFPYFGIWSAKDADFVCLEPWCGIADGVDHNQQLEQKEGIERLPPGKTWERTWEVTINR